MAVTLDAMIAEVSRELNTRRAVYPRWVKELRMTQAQSDAQIAAMAAVLALLQAGKAGHWPPVTPLPSGTVGMGQPIPTVFG